MSGKLKYPFTLVILILSLVLLPSCTGGRTSGYQLLVPYSAGGTADLTGRELAQLLGQELGEAVYVVNRPGASGAVGTKEAYDAPADGHHLLLATDSLDSQRVMGLSKLSYRDFSSLLLAVDDPKVLVVSAGSPYVDLSAFLKEVKEKPGRLTLAYTGPGGSGHIQNLLFAKEGYLLAPISYPGGNDALLAVMGGQVDATNANLSVALPLIRAGKLRALALASAAPLHVLPDVPLLQSQLPSFAAEENQVLTPLSVMLRKDCPAEGVRRIEEALQRVVERPEWKAFLEANALRPLAADYPDEKHREAFYARRESRVAWLLEEAGVTKLSPEKLGIPKP